MHTENDDFRSDAPINTVIDPLFTYHIGQLFLMRAHEEEFADELYFLAQTGPGLVELICVGDGNRWDEPFEVEDVHKVMFAELSRIAAGNSLRYIGYLSDYVPRCLRYL